MPEYTLAVKHDESVLQGQTESRSDPPVNPMNGAKTSLDTCGSRVIANLTVHKNSINLYLISQLGKAKSSPSAVW